MRVFEFPSPSYVRGIVCVSYDPESAVKTRNSIRRHPSVDQVTSVLTVSASYHVIVLFIVIFVLLTKSV